MALRIIFSLALLLCVSAFHAGPALAADDSANNCVALIGYKGTDPKSRSHIIRNNCARKIGLIFCHAPSAMPGTKSSACGHDGRFYQQRMSLDPGETHTNAFTQPADARLSWAACFDNQFHVKQHDRTSSQFYCDYPRKR